MMLSAFLPLLELERERERGREKRKPGERVWPTTVMIYGALSDN